MWLGLGELGLAVRFRDARLPEALSGVALPERASPPQTVVSTVTLDACGELEIAERTREVAAAGEPVVAGDNTGVVPPIYVYLGHDGTTIVLPDVGIASATSEWRRIEIRLVPEQACGAAARVLTALVFQDLAAHFGYFAIHASMVERTGVGVLFCGERARGKSTSCLAMGRAGWAIRCDDRCYIRPDPPTVWGPGGDMRLREDAVEVWEDLRGPLERGTPWAGKKRIALAELVADAGPGCARPRALFFPEVARRQGHRIAPLSAATALEELLCATGVASIPEHTARHFAAVADLVQSAPAYRLRLGPDMSALPPLIEEIVG